MTLGGGVGCNEVCTKAIDAEIGGRRVGTIRDAAILLAIAIGALLFLLNLTPSTHSADKSGTSAFEGDLEKHFGWPARWLAELWVADEPVVEEIEHENGVGHARVSWSNKRTLQSKKFGLAALALDAGFTVLAVFGFVLVGMALGGKRRRFVAILAVVVVTVCLVGLYLNADRLNAHL